LGGWPFNGSGREAPKEWVPIRGPRTTPKINQYDTGKGKKNLWCAPYFGSPRSKEGYHVQNGEDRGPTLVGRSCLNRLT